MLYYFFRYNKLLKQKNKQINLLIFLVTPTGFKPVTAGAEIQYSIQLNYGASKINIYELGFIHF